MIAGNEAFFSVNGTFQYIVNGFHGIIVFSVLRTEAQTLSSSLNDLTNGPSQKVSLLL